MTFFETVGQARVFLLLLYAGFLSGALYDGARGLRRGLPKFLRFLPDMIWCLLTAAACALALAAGGEGRVRLYALLGLCCGAGIYCLGIRRAGLYLLRFLKKQKPKSMEKHAER